MQTKRIRNSPTPLSTEHMNKTSTLPASDPRPSLISRLVPAPLSFLALPFHAEGNHLRPGHPAGERTAGVMLRVITPSRNCPPRPETRQTNCGFWWSAHSGRSIMLYDLMCCIRFIHQLVIIRVFPIAWKKARGVCRYSNLDLVTKSVVSISL